MDLVWFWYGFGTATGSLPDALKLGFLGQVMAMDRKRGKTEERAHSELLIELAQMEIWMQQFRLKEAFIPEDWGELEETAPVAPAKTKITIALDSRVVRWFRAMGRGYQGRINAVLRSYMLALISREVESRTERDWKGDPI
ncbi:BrnA antitoxin family protein [Algicella marina]|uniref:BrnA antitoxin of type II toxin-antitoxin system n=1 Tax=Algicella marina TaxID=2683284 RepID=A0A6P1T4L8_9RHOB|nr:BrnA antitoxin family protein [Algicella marina]QHQ35482.1 hypothetical protein GO499_09910 [Algicella marina]